MTSVRETVEQSRAQLAKLLKSSYADDSLLLGSLNFTQNKVLRFILQDLVANPGQSLPRDTDPTAPTAPELLDLLWLEFHYPVIKYYKAHFNRYKKAGQLARQVELRKLFDGFCKFSKTFADFYTTVVRELLGTYDVSGYVPLALLQEDFKITHPGTASVPATTAAPRIVYLIHKSLLSIGDLSRYRADISKNYLSSKAASKTDADLGVKYYKLCTLVLPSLGDGFDHIAIVDRLRDDHFNVVYNFLRSCMTRFPSSLGFANLVNLLATDPRDGSILKRYKESSIITDESKINTVEVLKLQFLCMFNYYFLPEYWGSKDGVLINGVVLRQLESAFFANLQDCDYSRKPIFAEIAQKQFLMLISGFQILSDKTNTFEHERLAKNSKIIGTYLSFIYRFIDNLLSTILENWPSYDSKKLDMPLLPLFRIVLNWIRSSKLGYQYLKQDKRVVSQLCKVLNSVYRIVSDHIDIVCEAVAESNDGFKFQDVGALVSTKFQRARFFKEDVYLKEFVPTGTYLKDFEDSHFFEQSSANTLRLVGRLTDADAAAAKSSKTTENALRLLAAGRLGKLLVLATTKGTAAGIKFDSTITQFVLQREPSSKDLTPDITRKAKADNAKPKKTKAPKSQRASSAESTTPVTQDPSTSVKIQETIEKYKQMHSNGDDILALIKKSQDANLNQSNYHAQMVENLVDDSEDINSDRSMTPMDPRHEIFQPTPTVPETKANNWSNIQNMNRATLSPNDTQQNAVYARYGNPTNVNFNPQNQTQLASAYGDLYKQFHTPSPNNSFTTNDQKNTGNYSGDNIN